MPAEVSAGEEGLADFVPVGDEVADFVGGHFVVERGLGFKFESEELLG